MYSYLVGGWFWSAEVFSLLLLTLHACPEGPTMFLENKKSVNLSVLLIIRSVPHPPLYMAQLLDDRQAPKNTPGQSIM